MQEAVKKRMRSWLPGFLIIFLSLLVGVLIFFVSPAFAGGVGTTGANFLKIQPGARGVALGGAFGAVADDAFGAYWNPAGIAEQPNSSLGFSHIEWLEGVTYDYIGSVFPLGNRAVTGLPLLIDDFEDGADPNRLGGSMGTWTDQDAGGRSIVTAGYRTEKRDHFYRLTFVIQPLPNGNPGSGGYWMSLEGKSARTFRYLVFRIRGIYGGEKIQVGLKDRKQVEYRVNLNDYGGVTKDWRQVVIPLSAFKEVDLTQLDNMSLSLEGSGAVYLDDLMFTGKRSNAQDIGFSAGYLTSGNIPKTVEIAAFPFYQESGSFDVASYVLGVSYAREFLFGPVYLPMGVTMKYIGENLADASTSGYGMDFGIMLAPNEGRRFRFGFAVQNIGSMKAFVREADALPLNVKTSFLLKSDSARTQFSADLDLPIDEEPRFRVGIEWWMTRWTGLRFGYAFGEKGEGLRGAAAGIGFRLGGFVLDYAYSPWGDFGNVHRLSATIAWGRVR